MKMRNLQSKLFLLSFLFLGIGLISKAQSWTIKPSGVTTNLLGVWFVTDTKGWAVGASGVILTTDDGGNTWIPQVSGVSVTLNDVVFVSPTTGWAVGGAQTILYTNDGGATWAVQNSSTSLQVELYSVFFTTPTTGFAAGSNGVPGILYTTTDAGATWQVSSSNIARGIRRIFFSSLDSGWVACARGMLYATIDGGSSWVEQLPVGANTFHDLHGLFMYDNNKGWVCGSSNIGIKHTNDGGTTWTDQNPNTIAGLLDITFTDSLTGWIVGSASTNGGYHIRYTTDGGVTWTLDSSLYLPTPSMKGVHFNNSSLGWAVGYDGYIVKYELSAAVGEIKSENNFLIYPNPASNSFRVQSLKFKEGDALKVTDILGKTILSFSLKDDETEIDVSKIERGIYFVKVLTSDAVNKFMTKRIVIH